MKQLLHGTLGLLGVLLLHGCQGSRHAGGVDGSVADAGPGDGSVPFDPSTTYPGEHAACRFSLQCSGADQLCVDGECIRHERVRADELAFGEWRRMSDTELWQSPLYTETTIPWSWFDGDMGAYYTPTWGITSWLVPSANGSPQMIFHPFHVSRCQFGIYGSELRTFSLPTMACSAITASEDGWVAAGGVRSDTHENHLVIWDPTGAIVYDEDLPEALNARVAQPENWGAGAEVGRPSALYFYQGKLYATAIRGRSELTNPLVWPTNSSNADVENGDVVHLVLDLDTKETSIVPIGGHDVQPGRYGWIVEDDEGLHSLYSRQLGPEFKDYGFVAVRWSDGATTTLRSEIARTGRYFQPTRRHWLLHVDWSPVCFTSVFDETGFVLSRSMYTDVSSCESTEAFALNRGGTRASIWLTSPWPSGLGFTTNQAVGAYDSTESFEQGIFLRWFDGAYQNQQTYTLEPPVEYEPGAAFVSRFGKSIEGPFVDDSHVNFVGWIERSLIRTTSVAGDD